MSTYRKFGIRPKVALGFGLLLLAVGVAAIIAYHSMSHLTEAVEDLSKPNTTIAKIDTILVKVSEAEITLQAYVISKSSAKLSAYHESVNQINEQILSLQEEEPYTDSLQKAKLDTISSLLNQKLVSFTTFQQINEQRKAFDFYRKALQELRIHENSKAKETTNTKLKRLSPQPITVDSSLSANKGNVVQKIEQAPGKTENGGGKAEGLLKIIGSWFSNSKKEKGTQTDSVPGGENVEIAQIREEQLELERQLEALKAEAASGITEDSIRKVLTEVSREQQRLQKILDEKELFFLSSNAEVMDKIYQLVSDIEKHQERSAAARTEIVHNNLKNSIQSIAIILTLAILSTGVVILLIFSDISRSDYYKQQLIRAKNKAEKLAKVKEDFLSNMSHEIRTPLTAILGYTEQLSHAAKLQNPENEYLNAIDSSSKHLLSIVNDILDLSKLEAGEVKLESAPFDMSSVIAQVYSHLKYQADKKQIDFGYTIQGEEHRFMKGDAFRLKQVLYNLLTNALKFTEKGEVSLHCILDDLPHEKIRATISVRDTGIGIPAAQLHSVFENFAQADISTTRKFGGTGLGLAISKKLIEQQGGSIRVESEEGKGSVFTVVIRYECAEEHEIISEKSDAIIVPEVFIEKHVLVIDDDRLNTQLAQTVLRKWGVHTTLAHSGKEALQYTENQNFDLILCDLHMPEMSGDLIAKNIRAYAHHASTPIIAFTANIFRKNWEKYKAAGIDNYLLKPFTEKDVYQLLCSYFGNGKVSSQPSEEILQQPAHPMMEHQGYTLENIKKFTGNDTEALVGFLEGFMVTNQNSIHHLKEALQNKDTAILSFYAHKMIPNIQHLGATELVTMLKKLELLTKEDVLTEEIARQAQKAVDLTQQLILYIEEEVLSLKTRV